MWVTNSILVNKEMTKKIEMIIETAILQIPTKETNTHLKDERSKGHMNFKPIQLLN